MAHNISRLDGTDQAWYADKPAWHGLGTVTPGARTAGQVIKAVPVFRKDVELAPVYARIGGKFVEIPDRRATHRAGSTDVMGIVSPEYEKLTDRDALALLEAVISEAGQRAKAGFVTAGLLGAKGARGFASIDLTRVFGKDLQVKRDPSRQECYLFGHWSHDGTAAMHTGLWNNRTECANMLEMAIAYATGRGLMATIRHAGDIAAQVEEAQRTLGLAELTAKRHVALMNALTAIPVTPRWMRDFVTLVVPLPDAGEGGASTVGKRALANIEDRRTSILELFAHSKTLVNVPQSAYRAYQAVAEDADHHRPLRIGPAVDPAFAADRRFRSITEGPAAEMKARALELLRQEFEIPSIGVPVPARALAAVKGQG